MASLSTMHGMGVYVDFSDEPKTGADMEWWYVTWPDGPYIRLLLQAKRLTGKGSKWGVHSYRELDHKIGKVLGAPLQAQALVREARSSPWPAYPLYIFYNPLTTLSMARESGVNNLRGVMLADGHEVREHVILSRRKKNRNFRRIGLLRPLLFPLSDLLCQPTPLRLEDRQLGTVVARFLAGMPFVDVTSAPSPAVIKKRLEHNHLRARKHRSTPYEPEEIKLGEGLPAHIRQAIIRHADGAGESDEPTLDRHRAIFVAGGELLGEDRAIFLRDFFRINLRR